MAVESYETVANIQMVLGLTDSDTGVKGPANLQFLLDTVSAAIAEKCGREFYPRTSTRTLYAPASPQLWVDDLVAITSVLVDGIALSTAANTDYSLVPFALSVLEPHYRTLVRLTGLRGIPRNWADKGAYSLVAINGTWAYQSFIPLPIQELCRKKTVALYERELVKYNFKSGSSAGGGPSSTFIKPPVNFDASDHTLLDPYILRWPRTNKPAWQGAL